MLRHGAMVVRDDVDEPVPGQGEVLVEVAACGICGSDLHYVHHAPAMMEVDVAHRGHAGPRAHADRTSSQDVFMGHEFCGRVLDVGPTTDGPAPDTFVTSVPIMVTATGIQDLAYTNLHAVRLQRADAAVVAADAARCPTAWPRRTPRSPSRWPSACTPSTAPGLQAGDGAVVVGCGPVGLAVIAALQLLGVGPDRRRRPLPGPPRRSASRWAPTRSSTPARRPRSRRGHASAAAARWPCSRPSACPG